MQIDDEFFESLQQDLKGQKGTDIVRESLTLLSWAIDERKRGRVILSADSEGLNVIRLAMPALEAIRQHK